MIVGQLPIGMVISFIAGNLVAVVGIVLYLRRKKKKMEDNLSEMFDDIGDFG